ncbi:putative secreted protein [Streptomyces davaonensis JCM 4913]|uniref:Putative secreted protein n=1 Tax=Streptomyces davaonensis (strain DSM 101723 / JCM 4913 / KCC S-0913 / 768) TaxID=1214101 RepID=K4QSK3_STRDJ|nr:hypothetical protein [Streptomyces davaonensis]CCK24801.1 putative secreted protein [Streptomyces davaonensis JCM 4913]
MTTPPHSPRLLLITTLVLTIAGVMLLVLPRSVDPSPTPSAHTAHAASTPVLPPHGEGVAGDRAIQQALETAWPADLTAHDEWQLVSAGRDLLRADATGTGRDQWPAFFGGPEQVLAPAVAPAGVRIQAVIARKDGDENRAVVHLVWAGTDRGGTYADGRITDLYFTRTTASDRKGGVRWIPRPRM